MSTPGAPVTADQAESVTTPANAEPVTEAQEQARKALEVTVEITDIKASGLPAKVGFFKLSGLFYVRFKGGKAPQKTKKAKYNKGDEFVAGWSDTVKLSGLEPSKVEIEVFARTFFFSYKIIKKTESKESLADLLEHAETPVELELLEEGQTAGKLMFKISRCADGAANAETPAAPAGSADPSPEDAVSTPESPEQGS